jgi:hypothetical protein
MPYWQLTTPESCIQKFIHALSEFGEGIIIAFCEGEVSSMAYTVERELTSGQLPSSPIIALDHHSIFYRFLKNRTKLLALIDYS